MDLSKKRRSADELEHIAKRLNQQPENVIINISDDDYHVMTDEEYSKYLDDMKYVVGGGDEEIPSSDVANEAQCVSVCDENEVDDDDSDYHVLTDEDDDDDYHVLSGEDADGYQVLSDEVEGDDDDYHVLSDDSDEEYVVGGQ